MNRFLKSAFLILLSSMAFAGHAETEVENLSPQLRALLKKEMLALENGMQAIIPAYVSGDMETIVSTASRMKNSYILKQEITEEQKQELAEKLPADFLAKDGQFHQTAGKLEHVAKEKNVELTGFYYSKLLESCVSCHSDHATHRFSNFKPPSSDEHHH